VLGHDDTSVLGVSVPDSVATVATAGGGGGAEGAAGGFFLLFFPIPPSGSPSAGARGMKKVP
jgi:hypothetical protein